jgi:hypothetical protein
MARVNVFFADEMLKAVDAEAERAGTSRSALIQTAMVAYMDAQQKAREEAEAQRRRDEACQRMDALAERLGEWDPVRALREFRDTRYGRAGRPIRYPRARRRR